MILAVTSLASKTGVLSQTVARLTFETFSLEHLAGCLMLKLIILAQETIAERTLKYPSTVIPYASLTFLTYGIHQRTDTGVCGEATSPVANPGLAVITYGSHHSQSRGEDAWMAHHAVSGLQHTLDLSTLGAHGQTLHTLAEVTEGTALLLLVTLVAFHYGIARKFRQIDLFLGGPDLLLSKLLLLGLLPLAGFLLRHFVTLAVRISMTNSVPLSFQSRYTYM